MISQLKKQNFKHLSKPIIIFSCVCSLNMGTLHSEPDTMNLETADAEEIAPYEDLVHQDPQPPNIYDRLNDPEYELV